MELLWQEREIFCRDICPSPVVCQLANLKRRKESNQHIQNLGNLVNNQENTNFKWDISQSAELVM